MLDLKAIAALKGHVLAANVNINPKPRQGVTVTRTTENGTKRQQWQRDLATERTKLLNADHVRREVDKRKVRVTRIDRRGETGKVVQKFRTTGQPAPTAATQIKDREHMSFMMLDGKAVATR